MMNEKVSKDTIVEAVREEYYKRSEIGQKKYNTTLDVNPAEIEEKLQHLKEELMDATLYIEWILRELKEKKQKNESSNTQETEIC